MQLKKVWLIVLRSLDVEVCALYWANAALEDIVVGGAVAANHSMKASITAKPTTANALAPPIHKIVRLMKPSSHHTLHSEAFVHMLAPLETPYF